MENNQNIKRAFGEDNITRRYIDYLNNEKNNTDLLPPFLPVLYRQVCCANDDNNINDVLRHKAINKKIKSQFLEKYELYSQLRSNL